MKEVLHRPDKNIVTVVTYDKLETDAQGNWTERTRTSIGEYQGKELKTVIKESRKIEYYK